MSTSTFVISYAYTVTYMTRARLWRKAALCICMNRSDSLSCGLALQRCRCHPMASSWLVAAVAAIAVKRHKGVGVRPTLADKVAFAPQVLRDIRSVCLTTRRL
jgi:hypothetical protein